MPVTSKLIPATLRPIFDKVLAGERVTDAEGETLYRSNDLNALGAMANAVRERKNGNVATYIHNQSREVVWAYGPTKDHSKCGTGSRKSKDCSPSRISRHVLS